MWPNSRAQGAHPKLDTRHLSEPRWDGILKRNATFGDDVANSLPFFFSFFCGNLLVQELWAPCVLPQRGAITAWDIEGGPGPRSGVVSLFLLAWLETSTEGALTARSESADGGVEWGDEASRIAFLLRCQGSFLEADETLCYREGDPWASLLVSQCFPSLCL